MSPKNRRHIRRSFVELIRYFVSVSSIKELEKVNNLENIGHDGISIDISEGGLGMITDYSLKKGDVLFFEKEIKIDDMVVNASIVRWAREIDDNKYRVGLEFVG
jgi:hypothetical protein